MIEKKERDALIKALGTTIREFVSRELAPIIRRLEELEQKQNQAELKMAAAQIDSRHQYE